MMPRVPIANPADRSGVLPGWAVSLALHAVLLCAAAVGLRGCQGTGQRGEAATDWKTVGLVTRPNATATAETESPPAESDVRQPAAATSSLPTALPTADDAPPVPLPDLLGGALPEMPGPGSAVPQFAATGDASLNPAGRIASAPTGLAAGETSFLNIRATGESFVYVIDSSGSMGNHNAMGLAKTELMASLQALRGDQRFGVIFYNERPHVVRLPGKAAGEDGLYWASDINRTLARQAVSGMQPELGTRFLPALEAALALKPAVIFFLTDADKLDFAARDLDQVRRWNTAGTRIHCIEFGIGSKLGRSSGLERLAEKNHGAYQYRDVTRGQ